MSLKNINTKSNYYSFINIVIYVLIFIKYNKNISIEKIPNIKILIESIKKINLININKLQKKDKNIFSVDEFSQIISLLNFKIGIINNKHKNQKSWLEIPKIALLSANPLSWASAEKY